MEGSEEDSSENILVPFGLRIEETSNCGRTLSATKTFAVGDVVLLDHPLITWDNNSMEDYVLKFVRADKETQKKILKMESHLNQDGDKFTALLAIAQSISSKLCSSEIGDELDSDLVYKLLQVKRTNAHSFGAHSQSSGALFQLASLANHSCRPNVSYSTDNGLMKFTAVRPIAIGESISPSYLRELFAAPYSSRQKSLLDSKDFVCFCERCAGLDDCRGLRCNSMVVTKEKGDKSSKVKCDGIAYCSNLNSTFQCQLCSKSTSCESLTVPLKMEALLLDRFKKLDKKFTDAVEPMSPSDFNGLIEDVSKLGFASTHYVALQVLRRYIAWCNGQADSLVEIGMAMDAQFMSPWGKVCSRITFYTDAMLAGVELIRLKECVNACCVRVNCSTEHAIVHDNCLDASFCTKNFVKLGRYYSSKKSVTYPASVLGKARKVAVRHLPLLEVQFGSSDDDVVDLKTFLGESIPGCANPSCGTTSSVLFGQGSDAVTSSLDKVQLKKCGKCELVAYCCRECQVSHFKSHKSACKR